MKKSISALACSAFLSVCLTSLSVAVSAKAAHQFEGSAATAPAIHKKKVHTKHNSTAKTRMLAKVKPSVHANKAKKHKKSMRPHGKKIKRHKTV
jgi:hypothetical protein